MIMTDLKATWRQKLSALREKPRPSNSAPSSARYRSEERMAFYFPTKDQEQKKPDSRKDVVTLKLFHADKYAGSHPRVTPIPEFLDTTSDFFNPRISADERFDKYMAELRRENAFVRTPSPIEDASVSGSSVRVYNRNSESRSSTANSIEYTPGSKGGGWKVLPGIPNPNKRVIFEHRIPVASVSNKDSERHLDYKT